MEYNKHSNTYAELTMANSGNFEDYEFVPAVIIETNDPLNYGRIKVSAPGSFNANNTDPRLLPWCYPWVMFGYVSYSSMEKGAKVWLIRNEKRHDECWYVPMNELHSAAQEYINNHADDNPEIISSRNNGGDIDSITYNSKDGYTISSGGSTINTNNGKGVSASNSENNNNNGGIVKVDTGGKISIGPKDTENGEPMILGNTLHALLIELLTYCEIMVFEFSQDVSDFNPGVASALLNAINDIHLKSLDDMYAETVTISETKLESTVSLIAKRKQAVMDAEKNANHDLKGGDFEGLAGGDFGGAGGGGDWGEDETNTTSTVKVSGSGEW